MAHGQRLLMLTEIKEVGMQDVAIFIEELLGVDLFLWVPLLLESKDADVNHTVCGNIYKHCFLCPVVLWFIIMTHRVA